MAANVDRRVHVDRTDKRVHLQPSYDDDVGYGYGYDYGYGADYKNRGPSSSQVLVFSLVFSFSFFFSFLGSQVFSFLITYNDY